LTCARALPDGFQPRAPAAVLLLSGEDQLTDTVVPRLHAAGADFDRVYTWNETAEPPVFPAACAALQELIEQTQARLVLLDPFFAFLGEDIGSLNEMMIRRALAPLARVAVATGAAVVLIRHLNKEGGSQAAYRGLGSIAILGAARTAFLIGPDPEDSERRVFACTKNNLAVMPASLDFRIERTNTGLPLIHWLGPVAWTADDLVQADRHRGEAVPRAVRFLQSQLAQGTRPRQALVEEAQQEGISFRTLERAKAELGVVSRQRREGGRNVWYWSLAAE
jgi:hypothetical protein